MTSSMRIPVAVASAVRGLRAAVQALLPDIQVACFDINDKGRVPESELVELSECQVLFCDPSVAEQVMVQENPSLKWMHLTWAGVEGIARFVRERKIQPTLMVSRTGDGFGPLIGEYVVGHVIAFERRFKETYKCQEARVWNSDLTKFRTLSDLTIGILGLGQIGREIARMCKALGMTVWGLVRDPYTPPQHPQFDGYSTLGELLTSCDYICSILPSTPQTQNLLSGNVLAACKSKKAIFINVGRGDVVDEGSLVNALNEGWLGGAILDVFKEEPVPESSPLWSVPNVVITPHASGPTLARQAAEGFVDNYRKFCKDEQLKYVVNWEKGY